MNDGDNVTCKCTEQGGNPAANVTWYKDGDQINNTSYEENILILTNVNETHNGIYMCKAQSYNLTDEEAIEVNVRLNCKYMYMIDIQVKYYTCSIMSKLTAPIPLIVT